MISQAFGIVFGSALLLQSTLAAPSADRPTPVIDKRQSEVQILEALESIAANDITQAIAIPAILSELSAIVPTATPTDPAHALSLLSSAYASATPTGYIEAAALVLENSLSPTNLPSLIQAADLTTGINDADNSNPNPPVSIYPQKLPCDAPYSVSEQNLRSQIYIPSTFTYGQKPPVILFPGTGGRGGQNFMGNFEVTFGNVDYADLVWVNPVNFLLADAQYNSELAAYAVNYISAISGGQNVSIIGWSQGNINIHWATKYWSSVRSVVSDHIAISPDYHGTILATFVDDDNNVAFSPSFIQQDYNSNYIKTLRSNGGDSAYVPTTNVYSGTFDEVVEPQQNGNASAILNDAHNVGVTNAQVQLVCGPDSPAGFFQTHESMLANSLSFALAVDALTHPGPGLVSRIDTSTVCQEVIAPGLSLENFLETEEAILVAAIEVLTFFEATNVEPAISSYALTSPTYCATASSTSQAKSTAAATTTKTSSTKTSSTKTSSTKTSSTLATSAKTSSGSVYSTTITYGSSLFTTTVTTLGHTVYAVVDPTSTAKTSAKTSAKTTAKATTTSSVAPGVTLSLAGIAITIGL